jgi:ABC-type Mn2+/Zn2+ transport system permease subunit
MLFTKVYRKIVLWSIIAGFAGTAAGYAISYFAGIPVGATIIFTLAVIWAVCKGFLWLGKKVRRVNPPTSVKTATSVKTDGTE